MAFSEREGAWTELSPHDAYALLETNGNAQLVDVRTQAEWTFVGIPDLSDVARDVILLEWQRYPDMAVSPDFLERLGTELSRRGANADTPLLFLCRSGARSAAAAQAAAQAGFTHCINIRDGFEGPFDPSRHRGQVAGWKAGGLPWIQS